MEPPPALSPRVEAFPAAPAGQSSASSSSPSSGHDTPRNSANKRGSIFSRSTETKQRAAERRGKQVVIEVTNSSSYEFQLDGEYFTTGAFAETLAVDEGTGKRSFERLAQNLAIPPNGTTNLVLNETGGGVGKSSTLHGLFWFVETRTLKHVLSVVVATTSSASAAKSPRNMACFCGKAPAELKDELASLEKKQVEVKYALNNGNGLGWKIKQREFCPFCSQLFGVGSSGDFELEMERAKSPREIASPVIPQVANFGSLVEGPKCRELPSGKSSPPQKMLSFPRKIPDVETQFAAKWTQPHKQMYHSKTGPTASRKT